MGIHAGICKAQKERQVMGGRASQKGVRMLGNSKKEKRVLLGRWEGGGGCGQTHCGNRDPGGCPAV